MPVWVPQTSTSQPLAFPPSSISLTSWGSWTRKTTLPLPKVTSTYRRLSLRLPMLGYSATASTKCLRAQRRHPCTTKKSQKVKTKIPAHPHRRPGSQIKHVQLQHSTRNYTPCSTILPPIDSYTFGSTTEKPSVNSKSWHTRTMRGNAFLAYSEKPPTLPSRHGKP